MRHGAYSRLPEETTFPGEDRGVERLRLLIGIITLWLYRVHIYTLIQLAADMWEVWKSSRAAEEMWVVS